MGDISTFRVEIFKMICHVYLICYMLFIFAGMMNVCNGIRGIKYITIIFIMYILSCSLYGVSDITQLVNFNNHRPYFLFAIATSILEYHFICPMIKYKCLDPWLFFWGSCATGTVAGIFLGYFKAFGE